MTECFVFLPQMRMGLDVLLGRARAAEAAGFTGLALMDHLSPPLALDQPMYEAMTTAAWLLAGTTTLKVGHLVLCDGFRHPAVLAREAVTLDHASGGRFELGIGSGSVDAEFATFGVTPTSARDRTDRLSETLQVVRRLWAGETFDFDGRFHHLAAAAQNPLPLERIPVVVGGAGPRTIALVAEHADWWNIPVHRLDRYDELRPAVGAARPSLQQMISFIPDESRRAEITELTNRRFRSFGSGLVVGNAEELTTHLNGLVDRGVERFYLWFTDFALPDTLHAFAEQVFPDLH